MNDYYNVRDLIYFTTKGIAPSYVNSSDVIVLNQKCIRNNKIDYSFAQYHDVAKTFTDSKKVEIGDILINSTGQGTAGRCAFVTQLPSEKTVIVDSHILIVRVEDFYTAGCLSYGLFSVERLLQSFLDGSTGQGEFDKQRLFNIILRLPHEKERQAVYLLLNKIDQKIEVNNRINAELEAMAKTLYDYWFVQFDFPNEDGKPYKSSGGKMVYNTTLKREIPEGWLFKRLSSLTNIITDTVIPEKSASKIFKYFSIPQFDENKIYKKEYGCNIKSNKFRVTENDLLISKLNPWFNRVVYPMAGEDQICSTEFVVLRTDDFESKSFLYCITTSKPFIDYCSQSSTGTSNSHKRIDPNLIINYAIPFQQQVIEKFSNISNPIIRKIIKNYYENARLVSLRDWLLPMLMNGQVTVK